MNREVRVKKVLTLMSVSACALVAFAAPASAANGGGCQLDGTANFSPGLGTTAQNFTYSFSGNLSGCQSASGGPATGTIIAGTNGLPTPTGNGSCGSSTTSGIAVAQWANGTTTVIQYNTTGATAEVALQGTVIASVTSSTGTTYTTTRYAGDSAFGNVFFQPPDPTACAGAGVTSAGISGAVGLGGSA
jgi:hypothetical protein